MYGGRLPIPAVKVEDMSTTNREDGKTTIVVLASEPSYSAFGNMVRKWLVCAICAGPSVPGKIGVLAGKKAVCYPGFEEYLVDRVETDEFVAADGNAITAKGAGVAVEFGLKIVERLCGEAEAQRIFKSIQCK